MGGDKNMGREEVKKMGEVENMKTYFRQLTNREKELCDMIRPTTFQDIVEEVRRDYDNKRYIRKHLMDLNNA